MKELFFQIQRLMDLPTTLETAELGPGGPTVGQQQAGSQAQPVHRVKSMFQQVALKLLLINVLITISFNLLNDLMIIFNMVIILTSSRPGS